ncbi:efflux RND transporter periplasmic adaptor subunit [Labrys sp. KB_33_2]|uniref:efflux RND transporter periplasmic adaptor subunit n=1 Tax=Labrys sp. KB_33_2 TaxID=3237479 RepID=UPI003F92AB0A
MISNLGNPMQLRRALLFGGLVAVLSPAIAWGGGPPARVGIVTARATDYRPSVSLTGDVEAQVQSDISFRVSGRIIERLVDVGDHVTPDQVLARVDGQEQRITLDTANAALASAQAQLQQSQAAYQRQKTLITSNATSQSSLDAAQENLSVAQASVSAATAQVEQAKEQLGYADLRAGVAGTVTARNAETGQVVQAGQTVVSIAQDGPRDAVFDVYEALIDKPPGSPEVGITLVADPRVKTTGHVREVSPIVDARKGTIRVKIGLKETPPGMSLGTAVRGEASLAPQRRFVLPASALFEWQGKPAVWTVTADQHQAQPRAVTLDRYTTHDVVLSGGLEDGEAVVVQGGQLLRPGQIVETVQIEKPVQSVETVLEQGQ